MQEFWEQYYMPKSPPTANQAMDPPAIPIFKNRMLQWQEGIDSDMTQLLDEYTRYCDTPVVKEAQDPRRWWLEDTQRKTYPSLSIMALDVFSIPAMSAEPERLFSGAKITISDRRNKLGIKNIEASECIKSWIKRGRHWIDID
jgi:hypothetical protein